MLLARVAEASEAVASTRSRKTKAAVISELLSEAARQGKVGIGWATVADLDSPDEPGPGLEVEAIDAFLDRFPSITGPGSQERRATALEALISGATPEEVGFLRRLLTGELRQGALEGVMVDAIATAFDVPVAAVRRAAMLSGNLGRTAAVAAVGEAALEEIGLSVLTAVQPMLAASAPDVATAVGQIGTSAVEWKLDGTRIQAHRSGGEVRIFTRNLNDVTDRLPTIVAGLRELEVDSVILDGESMTLASDVLPSPGGPWNSR